MVRVINCTSPLPSRIPSPKPSKVPAIPSRAASPMIRRKISLRVIPMARISPISARRCTTEKVMVL